MFYGKLIRIILKKSQTMPEILEDNTPPKKLVLFLGYGYVAKFVVDELIKNDFAHIILSTRDVPKIKKALFQKFFQRLTKGTKEETKKAPLPLDAVSYTHLTLPTTSRV